MSVEKLGNSIIAVVSEEHTFGTDALLLSYFANYRKSDIACDLGTGCGIIPLLWCRKEFSEITTVEIQEKACEQLRKAVKMNGIEDKFKIYNADLKNIKEILPRAKFNLVTMNPPYFEKNSGKTSISQAHLIARHEVECNLDDIMKAADYLLKFSGRFCMCHRVERLSEVLCKMTAYGIEPKRLRTVSKRADTAPWLILVEGRKGAKKGLTVEPGLYIYNENNQYTDEMKERILYREDF